ncbi:MAG TPA: KR domain-containing protein [Chloroflexota bacterium]
MTSFAHGTPIHGASILVTGGNRGFGLALVSEFLDRGAARVYATSRSAHTLGRGYEISKSGTWSATNGLRIQLATQGTRVTAIHVGYMDTDMAAGLQVPKVDPRDVARQTADAIEAGELEVLADDTTRRVKSGLAGDVTALYPQLLAAAPA